MFRSLLLSVSVATVLSSGILSRSIQADETPLKSSRKLKSVWKQQPVGKLATERKSSQTDSGGSSTDSTKKNSAENTNQDELRTKIERILNDYSQRHMNTRDHSPWEIIHGIVAFGVDTKVRLGGPEGKPVTAVGMLCFNHPCNGLGLFQPTGDSFLMLNGPGMQGHSGQFLAILAQSKVKIDYPIELRGKHFTVADLVEYEKKTCQPGTELTFKLIGLSHYLEDSDESWQNEYGQKWNIQRLMREEMAQPIRGATCGGTHRLFGLSYAIYKRSKDGLPLIGEYQRAKKYISDYHKYTYKLQNSDGSFSTQFFRGRGNSSDMGERLKTTGHILEWMVFSLPEEELYDPRLAKAANHLADILDGRSTHSWKVGPLGHALHSLKFYQDRVYNSNSRSALARQRRQTVHQPAGQTEPLSYKAASASSEKESKGENVSTASKPAEISGPTFPSF